MPPWPQHLPWVSSAALLSCPGWTAHSALASVPTPSLPVLSSVCRPRRRLLDPDQQPREARAGAPNVLNLQRPVCGGHGLSRRRQSLCECVGFRAQKLRQPTGGEGTFRPCKLLPLTPPALTLAAPAGGAGRFHAGRAGRRVLHLPPHKDAVRRGESSRDVMRCAWPRQLPAAGMPSPNPVAPFVL